MRPRRTREAVLVPTTSLGTGTAGNPVALGVRHLWDRLSAELLALLTVLYRSCRGPQGWTAVVGG